MKQLTSVEEINGWLAATGGLGEALLDELSLTRHGYSVHVAFMPVVVREGRRVLDQSTRVTFELEGVLDLHLRGALTQGMLENPEAINWGLSEVALVKLAPVAEGIRFDVRWEGDRRIHVFCARVSLLVPGSLG